MTGADDTRYQVADEPLARGSAQPSRSDNLTASKTQGFMHMQQLGFGCCVLNRK